MKRLVACAALLLLALPAAAAAASAAAENEVGGGFNLGLGVIDSDFYTAADAYFIWRTETVKLGAQVPLRLMLTGADGVRIRRQDWDEASDFTRLLRYFDWHPNEEVHVRLSEPTAVTLGHGAIVDHFYNATDLDHYKTALRVAWQRPGFDLDVFANDVVRWEVMAARGGYKPLGTSTSWARDLQVAATVAVDRAAPTGTPGLIDETNQPVVLRAPIWLYGVDADIPLWRGAQRQLLLYSDVVGMYHRPSFAGVPTGTSGTTGGWHLGLRLQLPSVAPDTDVTLRLEAVYMGHGYLPGWFDNLYEVERFHVQAAQNAEYLNKVAWAAQNTGPLGVRTQLDIVADKGLRLTALLAWLGSDGLSTQLWLTTPEMAGLTVRAHWGQQHLQTAADWGALDRTAALGEVRYRISAALSASLQAGTRWQAKDDGYAARRELFGAARFEWKL